VNQNQSVGSEDGIWTELPTSIYKLSINGGGEADLVSGIFIFS
jgi:hypothetical protein